MKVKHLIKQLNALRDKNKEIVLLGNQANYEDSDYDISFDRLDVWDDGDTTITLFVSNGETN
jgi:hypothetical protein